jgi:hypothetical protein
MGLPPATNTLANLETAKNDPPAKALDAVSVPAPSLPVGAAIFKPGQDSLWQRLIWLEVPIFVTSDRK